MEKDDGRRVGEERRQEESSWFCRCLCQRADVGECVADGSLVVAEEERAHDFAVVALEDAVKKRRCGFWLAADGGFAVWICSFSCEAEPVEGDCLLGKLVFDRDHLLVCLVEADDSLFCLTSPVKTAAFINAELIWRPRPAGLGLTADRRPKHIYRRGPQKGAG